jgi:glutamyl-Q tRNA(Asp) synthetase
MAFVTRFAPSPTGPLHLGHAYSAFLAHDMAMTEGGTFLLRIEDIDQSRCRPAWEAQIYDDLQWLGLWWPEPVMRQSTRAAVYRDAIAGLEERGYLYPCRCNRRDILAATSAPQEGSVPMMGPDGIVYPGTCRDWGGSVRAGYADGTDMHDYPLRLDMRRAGQIVCEHRIARASGCQYFVDFQEHGRSPDGQHGLIETSRDVLVTDIGDIVIARRDMGTSYHLSVVVDDAAQGITHVTRGEDLFDATKIHVVLQRLLGLPTPIYHHHRLIRDDQGKRLAKRDDARALSKYRAEGATPQDIRRMVGLKG